MVAITGVIAFICIFLSYVIDNESVSYWLTRIGFVFIGLSGVVSIFSI